MATINVKTDLPMCLIEKFRNQGATIREDCKIKIIELVDEPVTSIYTEFLTNELEGDIDPLLSPDFGDVLSPYISPHVQREVHQLLATFQPLRADDFRPHTPNPVLVNHMPQPLGGYYQYSHAKIAIHKVMAEIENPREEFHLSLNNVPSGNVICDMTITYSNCVVIRRIRRF